MHSGAMPFLGIALLLLGNLLPAAHAGLFGFGQKAVAPVAEEWSHYHDQDKMEAKLVEVQQKCANISRLYSIGKSVEGRDLVVLEFSTTPGVHEAGKYCNIVLVVVIVIVVHFLY